MFNFSFVSGVKFMLETLVVGRGALNTLEVTILPILIDFNNCWFLIQIIGYKKDKGIIIIIFYILKSFSVWRLLTFKKGNSYKN
jgi:hypothetical protein